MTWKSEESSIEKSVQCLVLCVWQWPDSWTYLHAKTCASPSFLSAWVSKKPEENGMLCFHVSCIYKSVCLFTSRVALSTWPEAWESHERMGSPGQAFLISCGESPKPGKQTFAHFFTISTWGRRQLTWGKRQLPSPCWDCINFFLPAYCEKQPGIRYWYSSIQSKLKCRGVVLYYVATPDCRSLDAVSLRATVTFKRSQMKGLWSVQESALKCMYARTWLVWTEWRSTEKHIDSSETVRKWILPCIRKPQ